MINQFEINGYVKRQITELLEQRQMDLNTAMEDEAVNREIAALLYGGLPAMLRKFYSLNKFQGFFWEKRAFLTEHIANRLDAALKRG
ncbi:hypothetical protein LNQ82_05925 [Conchiformibius steedae DSM 2580]|uniref:Uncharacterized protein n=2 Tax=Conchiformibius steedae TaxID=153493 RepID=A0A3P2A271_9NEIS|nr:hypothetical protein [Conchiformibius steedae]QMT33999.1 hypothetical protein H3L98_03005 [Conchiformibius steedae]RRD89531.1 hypothetical protein EII21_08470 [Conchiformibius steedae]URD66770.1 hypothetical protein LNQ82_05925 [Conchiformibius steedae DSM 2580]